MQGRAMRIFAMALVPGGNILVHISAAKRAVPDFFSHLEGQALPEGIYLGFFSSHRRSGGDALRKVFRSRAQELFKDIPPRLQFGKIRQVRTSFFLVPSVGDLPLSPLEAALRMATETGLDVMANPPFLPGLGFFMGNNVTPERIDAFSFSYMDAVLMEIRSRDPSWASASWAVTARQGRRKSLLREEAKDHPHGETAVPVL